MGICAIVDLKYLNTFGQDKNIAVWINRKSIQHSAVSIVTVMENVFMEEFWTRMRLVMVLVLMITIHHKYWDLVHITIAVMRTNVSKPMICVEGILFAKTILMIQTVMNILGVFHT